MPYTPEEKKERARIRALEYSRRPEIKERRRQYYQQAEVKARQAAYQRTPKVKARIRENNHKPEVKARNYERNRQWREANPNYKKIRRPIRNEQNLRKQEFIAGRARPDICDVCGGNDGGIVFDHDHQTGNFRGWTCWADNIVLGLVNDDPQRLRRLADYLERKQVNTSPQLTLSF